MHNKKNKAAEWSNPVNFLLGSTDAESGVPVDNEVIETFEQK